MRELQRLERKNVDCYDLETGKLTTLKSHYKWAEYFDMGITVIQRAISDARPIQGRYFLIYTEECIKNRSHIIKNQMSYYHNDLVLSKEERFLRSVKRSRLYKRVKQTR